MTPPPIYNITYIYKRNTLDFAPEMWGKPMLFGVEPAVVRMMGGRIYFTGANLRNTLAVYVGGFPCTDVTVFPLSDDDAEGDDDRYLACDVGYNRPGTHHIELGMPSSPWAGGFYVTLPVALYEAPNFQNPNEFYQSFSSFFDTALWSWTLEYAEQCEVGYEPTWYAPEDDVTYQTVEYCNALLPDAYEEFAAINNSALITALLARLSLIHI